MCAKFVRGNCDRGNNCKFAHDERYRSQAKSRLDGRKSSPRKKGRGKGKGGKGRGRSAGAVADGEADGEDNEEEPEFIDVDMDLPAEDDE